MIFSADKPSRAIVKLIDERPDEWGFDGYDLKGFGLLIWVANGPWAIEIVGGATRLYGHHLPFPSASQVHIWRAYKRWRQRRVLKILEDAK